MAYLFLLLLCFLVFHLYRRNRKLKKDDPIEAIRMENL